MKAQYLDNAGLQELVKKTKEYARKSAKDAVNASAALASKTIIDWDDATSAAIYGDIAIEESQVNGLVHDLELKAPLASPAFTGVPTAPTADTSASNTQIATTQYVKNVVGNIGEAMHYKGAVNSDTDLPLTGYVAGDTYKVATAGTYAGQQCEVGDMIIANKTYTEGASNADWDVIQTNIDGAVTGPGSATDGAFVLFNGTTGKIIKNSDVNPSSFKRIQSSAAFAGDVLKTIQNIEQNANGDISVTYQNIQSATTSQKGVVELAGSIAATIDSENNKAATEKAVRDAINALDVPAVTVGPSNTLVSISEADGKISTSAVAIQIAESQVTGLETDLDKIATSAANLNTKIEAVSGAVATSAAALDAKITAVSGAVQDLDADVDSTGGVNVSANIVETDGKIVSLTLVDNSVNATDVSGIVNNYIDGLDVAAITADASHTITSISETDGKIAATYSPIAITSAQVTNLGQTLTDLIDGLDVAATAIPTSGTITSISEENGKISVSSGAISISVTQVNDLSRITETQIDNLFLGD